MHIIDPLKLKLDELLSEGNANVLNHARLRYGTEKDLGVLLEACEAAGRATARGLLVDFTPFDRIGRPAEFLDALAKVGRYARPALLANGLGLLSQLKAVRKKLPVEVAQFDDDGNLVKLHGSSQSGASLKDVIRAEFIHGANGEPAPLVSVRRRLANELLTKMLFRHSCLVRPQGRPLSVRKGGTSFMRMRNGMLVSCYLNLKELGMDPRCLTAIAYEVLLVLSGHFRRDRNPLDDFDVLVVPNNTALFLAATLQQLLEKKPLVAIDRLGPIPAKYIQIQPLLCQLEKKRVVLIEEVVATGNEVDRSLLFLRPLQAEVKLIIALYDLDVGSPMLIERDQLTSLCHPKRQLGYVYRSA